MLNTSQSTGEIRQEPGATPTIHATTFASFDVLFVLTRVRTIEDMARQATQLLYSHPLEPTWRGLALMMRGVAAQLSGHHESSLPTLRVAELESRTSPLVHSLVLCHQAFGYFAGRSWIEAVQLTNRAAEEVEANGLEHHPLTAVVHAAAAAMAPDRHRRTTSDHHQRARSLLLELGDLAPWLQAETALLLAAGDAAHGRMTDATSALDLASTSLRRVEDATEIWRLNRLLRLAVARHRGDRFIEIALTPSEASLLHQLVTRDTLAAIAERRMVARNTVKAQASSLYRKLGAENRKDAVDRARQRGLI